MIEVIPFVSKLLPWRVLISARPLPIRFHYRCMGQKLIVAPFLRLIIQKTTLCLIIHFYQRAFLILSIRTRHLIIILLCLAMQVLLTKVNIHFLLADELISRIFLGQKQNKRIPLTSVGMKWDMLKNPLFKINWLSYLNLRFTWGINGNINKSMLAYTTAERASVNRYNEPVVGIINQANDYLRWEKSSMFNIGLDWADAGRHFIFTFEYYWRQSSFLLAPSFRVSLLMAAGCCGIMLLNLAEKGLISV